MQLKEDLERDAALVLCPERAADVAEGAGFAPEHVDEGVHEQAVQVGRLGGESFLQGGQLCFEFDRVQHDTPFRAG